MTARKPRTLRTCLTKPTSPALAAIYVELAVAVHNVLLVKAGEARGQVDQQHLDDAFCRYLAVVNVLHNLSLALQGHDAAVWAAARESSLGILDRLLDRYR